MNIVAIKAPSHLGVHDPGVAEFPHRLSSRHHSQLGMVCQECAPAVLPIDCQYSHRVAALQSYIPELAGVVSEVWQGNGFPLVIGGDKTVSLAAALALRRLTDNRAFLSFTSDLCLRKPRTMRKGSELASMVTAMICGQGPPALTNFNSLGPYVEAEDMILVGVGKCRDKKANKHQLRPRALGIHVYRQLELKSLVSVDQRLETMRKIIKKWRKRGAKIWLELDVGVVLRESLPCVTSKIKGKMPRWVLTDIVNWLLKHECFVGMTITGFDCRLDPNDVFLGHLAEMINKFFIEGKIARVA